MGKRTILYKLRNPTSHRGTKLLLYVFFFSKVGYFPSPEIFSNLILTESWDLWTNFLLKVFRTEGHDFILINFNLQTKFAGECCHNRCWIYCRMPSVVFTYKQVAGFRAMHVWLHWSWYLSYRVKLLWKKNLSISMNTKIPALLIDKRKS